MLRTSTLLLGLLFSFCGWSQLTIDVIAYSTTCNGSSTGVVQMTPLNAAGEVSYDTDLDLSALSAGEYTFSATDEGGQTAEVSFEILDQPAVCGCTYNQAFNYSNSADVDDGSCVFATGETCLADIVPDGVVGTNDLLQLLVEFGEVCQ